MPPPADIDQRPAIESAFAAQKLGDGVMLLARVNGLPGLD
jgi:hypothetical protein